jgi:hypothetical protein
MPIFPYPIPFPLSAPPYAEAAGITTTGAPYLTALTTGTANAFGSWAQLLASTAKRAVAVVIAMSSSYANYVYRVQIGVGAAASEVAVAEASGMCGDAVVSYEGINYVTIPVLIPGGSRVSARAAHEGASKTVYFGAYMLEMD